MICDEPWPELKIYLFCVLLSCDVYMLSIEVEAAVNGTKVIFIMCIHERDYWHAHMTYMTSMFFWH